MRHEKLHFKKREKWRKESLIGSSNNHNLSVIIRFLLTLLLVTLQLFEGILVKTRSRNKLINYAELAEVTNHKTKNTKRS